MTQHRIAAVLVGLAYALTLFGRFTPQPFRDIPEPWATAAWLASLVESLQFHGGLLLVLVLARVAFSKAWVPIALALPLVVWLVALPMLHGLQDQSTRANTSAALEAHDVEVVSANLLVGNEGRAEDVAREVTRGRPHVIALQEYSQNWKRELAPSLERKGYTSLIDETREDSFGMAIYSRLDGDGERISGTDATPQFRAELEIGDGTFVVYAVHTLPPTSRDFARENRTHLRDLTRRLDRETGSVIAVGDFNATRDSVIDRAFADIDVVDAWEALGTGRGSTWIPPALDGWFPGLQLDHVYVKNAAPEQISRRDPNGSDHRPLAADVTVFVPASAMDTASTDR